MKLLDKVKKRLEENYGVDFLSEFWTDDQIVLLEDIVDATEKEVKNIAVTPCCKSDSELLNVSYNVGDKVTFDNKKAVVLWTSVNYLDIEIVGTNKILQGVHTSKVLPR